LGKIPGLLAQPDPLIRSGHGTQIPNIRDSFTSLEPQLPGGWNDDIMHRNEYIIHNADKYPRLSLRLVSPRRWLNLIVWVAGAWVDFTTT